MHLMKHTHRGIVKFGFLLMAIGVALGAFGAHNLKETLDDTSLDTWETGIKYLFIHAAALIVLGISHRKFDESKLNLALRLFILGIFLFSGSLILLASSSIWAGSKQTFLGAIAPLGGVSFIAGWVILFLRGFELEKDSGGISSSSSKRSRFGRHRKHRHSREGSSDKSSENTGDTVS